MLKVRPHTKSGGGGGGHSASGPIPLPLSEIMPLFGTQKIPTYVLPRYTSHARANEHAGTYFFVIHMLGGVRPPRPRPPPPKSATVAFTHVYRYDNAQQSECHYGDWITYCGLKGTKGGNECATQPCNMQASFVRKG